MKYREAFVPQKTPQRSLGGLLQVTEFRGHRLREERWYWNLLVKVGWQLEEPLRGDRGEGQQWRV